MGPLTFGKREEQIFLGKEFSRHKDYSESTAEAIDKEVMVIINERYNYANKLLTENLETLKKVAEALLERETLDASDIDILVQGGELSPPEIKPEKPVKPEKPDEGKEADASDAVEPGDMAPGTTS
jgi:cell division protease FtsH